MRSEDTLISWTHQVREELIRYYTKSVKCQRAELTALLLLNPDSVRYDREKKIYIYEEQAVTGKNNFTEKHKTYNMKGELDLSVDPQDLYQDMESRRAFLRGAFLASGSFTDPNKSYQLEIITKGRWEAEKLISLMAEFDIRARIMRRKSKYVAYLKEGPAIVDMLNVIGAHRTLMEFENIRILKEMRESVNRQVNCETANINKAVTASMKQLEDIDLIRRNIGLEHLDENLRNICLARLEHPDVGLSELGNLMTPPLGKSGVNHRFRKLNQLAEQIREQQRI